MPWLSGSCCLARIHLFSLLVKSVDPIKCKLTLSRMSFRRPFSLFQILGRTWRGIIVVMTARMILAAAGGMDETTSTILLPVRLRRGRYTAGV
jgi:hypothetical protein